LQAPLELAASRRHWGGYGYTPEPKEFFGTAFWIGFTLQMIAAEIWINYTRPTAAAQMAMLSSEVTGGLLRTD